VNSRGDSQLLRQQLAAVQTERDELKEQLHILKEQSLPDDEVRSLPDAAELLQQLRVKSPKLKVGLRDLEMILEAIGEA